MSVGTNLELAANGKTLVGGVVDISCSGVGVFIRKNLSILSKYPIKLKIPYTDSHFSVLGEIVRKSFYKDKRIYKYGIRFIDADLINTADHNQILRKSIMEQNEEAIQDERDKIKSFFEKDIQQFTNAMNKVYDQFCRKEISEAICQDGIYKLCDEVANKAGQLDIYISNKKKKRYLRELFRIITGNLIYQSVLSKQGLDKPKGYPGDYELLEKIYDNSPVSDNLGYFIDNGFLSNPYAKAVRNRKEKMASLLLEFIIDAQEDVNILNFACGSCREVKEILCYLSDCRHNVKMTLVDYDAGALSYSRYILERYNKSSYVQLDFRQEDILKIIKMPQDYRKFFSGQDFIYSIGLVDYLPDRVLGKFIEFCVSILKLRGKLVITFKNREKYNPIPLDWFCDWHFVARNKEKAVSIVRNSINGRQFNVKVDEEKSGITFFVIVDCER